MRALRQAAPGAPLTLEEIDAPTAHGRDVVVRIEASGVLSYHRQVLSGERGYALPPHPFSPGTDGVGTVLAVGPDVTELTPGTRVIVDPRIRSSDLAGEAEEMLLALTGLTAGADALQQRWRDGTWAEQCLVPASNLTVLDAGDETSAAELARYYKFSVAFGGWHRGRLQAGEAAVVHGATGNFGAPAVPLALALGASCVVALGRNEAVLAELAALDARVRPVRLSGDAERDAVRIREAIGGPADIGLDLGGELPDSAGATAVLTSLRDRGRFVIQGSMTAPLEIDYASFMRRSIELLGAFMYPRDTFRRLQALVHSGQLDPGCISVEAFDLEDHEAALAAAAQVRGLGKVVLTP